ncbi:MAG TPA: CHASE3 domain-containing protein [Gammaproteobacteria bacterium]|nr:CHASE3 domain-containing protein [Gammaproteobacteria bacterium]
MADEMTGPGSAPPPVPRQLRLVFTVFIAALLLLAGVASLAYYSTAQNAKSARWVDHTYQVIVKTGQVFADLRGATATARGYLITGDASLLGLYRQYASAVLPGIDALRPMVADNPAQLAGVEAMHKVTAQELQGLAEMLLRHPMTAASNKVVATPVTASHRQMDELAALTEQMVTAERQLLATRSAEASRGRHLTLWVIAAGNLVSLLALLACLWLLTREIAHRRRAERHVKALNHELASGNVQLAASNRELEGFSYSISHDLRSPLRAIDGYAKLLEAHMGAALDDEARRLLGLVSDNTRRMAALIDDLLAFSRLGRKALEREDLDMTVLATQCVAEALQVSAARPQVMVAPLPPSRGDRTLMRQVWMNLIANAVKYSQGNPAASIEVRGRIQQGECEYSVSDNGVGFDMQYYHKLFGVFQRLHGVEEFPGTGVGLAIAMRIVTKHGGRIWADAVPGQGATFFFTLPRAEDAK